MPSIDLSDVTLSDDIAGEPFEVVIRTETVDANGIVQITPMTVGGMVGGISPTGDNSLLREEAFQTQMNTIQVITMFPLIGAAKNSGVTYQPDLVIWPAGSGQHYLVRSVNDFTHYGAGFVVAECIEYDWAHALPAPNP